MELGIFAKTYSRPAVEQVFAAVAADGLRCVQFNMACSGLPSMPDSIPDDLIRRVREAADQFGIEILAVSGTYNMIHPDPQLRLQGLRRLQTLAAACVGLGTRVITLCTGTRDPADMWRWHPENATSEAWAELLQQMETALTIAEQYGVMLAFEPEHANVVSSASHGQALLAAMQSPCLKVVIDPANLVDPHQPLTMNPIMSQAFDLLGESLIMAHGKDRGADGSFLAAGTGILDFDHYLRLLHDHAPHIPLVMHGLSEAQVPSSSNFLRARMLQD